jgi:uncharacterized membrane protein YccC
MRLSKLRNLTAVHYAIRILIGTTIVSYLLRDVEVKIAWTSFVARFFNTVIGSACGLFFLLVFGVHSGLLPLTASFAALLSMLLTRMRQGWRIGPVTAVLIMSAGVTEHSPHDALELALQRTLAVFLGSLVALLVTWMVAQFWLPASEPPKEKETIS